MSKKEKVIGSEDIRKIDSDLKKMGIEEYEETYGLKLEYEPSEDGLDIRYILVSKEHHGKGLEKDIIKMLCVSLDNHQIYAKYRIANENDFEYFDKLGFKRNEGNILVREPR